MRFIKYIFFFTFLFLIFFIVSSIVWQEYVLASARNQLMNKIDQYSKSTSTAQVYEYCRDLGSVNLGDRSIYHIQLRFLNDQDYVIEGVCDQYEFSPNVIFEGSLGKQVKKIAGSSGLMLQPGVWRVSLKANTSWLPEEVVQTKLAQLLFSRVKEVQVIDGKLSPSNSVDLQANQDTPVTSCEGYGFKCCAIVAEVGVGETREANDCSESCFQSCQVIPQILWLATNNNFDRQQRQATVGSGEAVSFTFVGNSPDPKNTMAKMNFGDGQVWEGPMQTESIIHTYSCSTRECLYVADVVLVDSSGRTSVMTDNSSIDIYVRGK